MIESKRSESIMNLAAALAVAQGQIRTAAKSETANTGKFSYSYSPLDEIWDVARKPLSENGLSVVQVPTNDESGFYLETILIHSSGEWISGQMSLPVEAGRMSQLQAMGSAITYARRYMLSSMVGIATGDDDDGQAAAQVERKPECMTLSKMLSNLNKIKSVSGFYQKPDDILACRSTLTDLPEPDDLNGWRVLFADARDYAIAERAVIVEDWQKLNPTKKEFFNAAKSDLGLDVITAASMLKEAGFTNGYDPEAAPDMWAALLNGPMPETMAVQPDEPQTLEDAEDVVRLFAEPPVSDVNYYAGDE
jgi:hypothetical protein